MLHESKNKSEKCSQQAHSIVLTSIECCLYVMDVGLMSKERSVPAGLNFKEQVFCVKCGTPLSMSYLLQTHKTNNLVSNKNRQVGSCLINILLHISKNVLGVV